MKKFYIPIFVAIFLVFSFYSQGQVYNSITSNPLGFTLDDPRFWQGGVPVPNGCPGCTIKIYSDVVVVPHDGQLAANGGIGTSSMAPGANDPALDHITVHNSTINVYGNTTLTLNSWLTLDNSVITIGNDPTSVETIFVNDQVELINGSSVQLANGSTTVDATNFNTNAKTTLLGPYTVGTVPFAGTPLPGIYAVRATNPGAGGYDATLNKLLMANYNSSYSFLEYTINCGAFPLTPCGSGVIYGPAKTLFDATLGTAPAQGFIGFEESVTLPVQLVQFLATKNDDGTVKVSWATAQEENSDFFDVERSGDQTAWASIGTVKAKGFSSISTNYFLTDKSPLSGTGYYRLKMVDLDGKFKYSPTVTITSDKNTVPLVIYSNPFFDQIRLKINLSRPQNLMMTVADMQGKTYVTQSYQAQSGDNFVNIQPSVSSSGMYILRIQGETYNQTVKLEKQ